MILKIAFRNIFRQKRRSTLTLLSMVGGFTLASFSIGWADGSYNFIINMFTRNQLGHIKINASGYRERPSLYKTIADYRETGKELDGLKGVESWSPRIFSAGLISVKEKSAGARLVGIDPQRENQTTRFNQQIIKGEAFTDSSSQQAILGKGLAQTLAAEPGDTLVFVSQAADGSIANDWYEIVGLIETGDDISDRMVFYLPLRQSQEVLVLGNRVHEITLVCTQLSLVETLTQKIRARLRGQDLEVTPWQEFARSFYQAMQADKQGMWIMLFVIILIVSVGVLNTVLMSVLERQHEYGLLKAIGTRPTAIFTLVLSEVTILALFSIGIGMVLSVLINSLVGVQGISLPQTFTYGGMEFKTLYTEANARSLYIPGITVMLSASFISIFPAMRAARTEPARIMRI